MNFQKKKVFECSYRKTRFDSLPISAGISPEKLQPTKILNKNNKVKLTLWSMIYKPTTNERITLFVVEILHRKNQWQFVKHFAGTSKSHVSNKIATHY
jgi:hypothetical protein